MNNRKDGGVIEKPNYQLTPSTISITTNYDGGDRKTHNIQNENY